MSNRVINAKNRKPIDPKEARNVLVEAGCLNTVNPIPASAKALSERIVDMPVDTPSLVNRDTTLKNLKKILSVSGGVDGHKWQSPRAGRVRETGEAFIFDGDHSRHIFCFYNPEAETMPMRVIEVESKAQIHDFFVNVNAKGRTPINAEQIFVHEYLAGHQEAQEIAADLEAVGLRVYCSNERDGTAGDTNGYLTKIGSAKRCLKLCKKTYKPLKVYEEAVRFLGSCLEQNSSSWSACRDRLPGELVGGLICFFIAYPDFREGGKHYEKLYDYFASEFSYKKVTRVAEFLKENYSSITNYAEYSIGRGLAKFVNDERDSFGLQEKLDYRNINCFKSISLTGK
jgi:hypothetical protein